MERAKGSLALLIAGQGLSTLGDQFFAVALPVVVLAEHGHGTGAGTGMGTGTGTGTGALSVVLAVYGTSRIAGLLVGGRLADRFGPRGIMLAADLIRAPAVAAVGWAAVDGRLLGAAVADSRLDSTVATGGGALGAAMADGWLLLACVAVLGLAGGVFLPASFSMIPAIVPATRLKQANGYSFATTQLAALAGPAGAGLFIGGFGAGAAMAVDAATYAVSVLTLCFVRAAPPNRPQPTEARQDRAPTEVNAGWPRPTGARLDRTLPTEADQAPPTGVWSVLGRSPLLRTIVGTAAVAGVGFSGVLAVGLPTRVAEFGPPFATGYGFVLAAFGLGALLGGLAAGRLRGSSLRGALVLTLAQAAMLGLAGAVTGAVPLAALLFGVGAVNAVVNVRLMTLVQSEVPAAVRGRVTATLLLASFGTYPVGTGLAGAVAAASAPATVFYVGSALLATAAAVGLACANRPANPSGDLA
jgi:MFS family permease